MSPSENSSEPDTSKPPGVVGTDGHHEAEPDRDKIETPSANGAQGHANQDAVISQAPEDASGSVIPPQDATQLPTATQHTEKLLDGPKFKSSATQTDPDTDIDNAPVRVVGNGDSRGSDDESKTAEDVPEPDSVEEVPSSAIGRIYRKDGKRLVIDESQWKPTITEDTTTRFSVMYEMEETDKTRVFLKSKYLQKLFNAFCKRKLYPASSIQPDGIAIPKPYAPLFFHYDEMLAAAEQPEFTKKFDSDQVQKDLDGLKSWYENWVAASHEAARDAIKRDSVEFNSLWAVFKPGDLLYGLDDFGQARLYVIAATKYRSGIDTLGDDVEMDMMSSFVPMIQSFMNLKRRFAVESWFLDWDSSSRVFKRRSFVSGIPVYTGTRRISDLDVFPLRHYKGGDQAAIDELLSRLDERGRLWKSIMVSSSTCMHHDGPALELDATKDALFRRKNDHIHLNDRVMADNDGWALFGDKTSLPPPIKTMMSSMADAGTSESPILVGGFDETYAKYDKCSPEDEFDALQAQLCPSQLYCCAIRTTKWYVATIASLKPIQWKREAIDNLVVNPNTKKVLRGLVEEHKKNRSQDEIISDFIPDKGCGLVLVLHGPPGVGKTLTAECIAEYTGKPLYSINIGELSSEQNIAARLENIFEQASRWDAVLLIDEADVVLEQRSLENIKRNAIVSIFLRMLEYYRGILFLTTNRLATMDVAFQSRVSLAIKYSELSPALRRQIWLNFIARLGSSETEAKEQLLARLDDIKEWKLNGRQIRNVITMAQSLALAENRMRGRLRFDHIQQVAADTLGFQDLFEEEYRTSKVQLSNMGSHRFPENEVEPYARGTLTQSFRANHWQ
ncbi:hypothetical protein PFICI_00467 [Pestalotiopsis fici W106-1]|uniref:AAA+ ATPase domain-containing protein n=1 Tax=Pestalotiopsis fici (strain W106-1 / CGMCC3.15140) TaxID=1229662 RepID=W3XKV4_PESFW|nr:uncharacterized protein PFICI_00467 [Pestalotiopsis fici W106-1]ETS86639.1 hypothetical protein PFICI_00467 [Pestalotiopsis fici W106-1]